MSAPPPPSGSEEIVLVFDLWNTLAFNDQSINPFDALVRAFGLDPRVAAHRHAVEQPFMVEPFASMEEALVHLSRVLERSVQGRAEVLAIWEQAEQTARLFPDVLPSLERLQGRHRTVLLSNTQPFGMGKLWDSGLLDRLDARLLSYEHRRAKPDPEFFAAAAAEMGVEPGRAVMIGDSFSNDIRPARKAGFREAVLIDRAGGAPERLRLEEGERAPPVVRDLEELLDRLAEWIDGPGTRGA